MPKRSSYRRRYKARPERPFTSAAETFCRCETSHVLEIRNPGGTDQTERSFNLMFKWQQPAQAGDIPGSDVFGFDSGGASNRFLDMRENWQQFAITGLRIEFYPSSLVAVYGSS